MSLKVFLKVMRKTGTAFDLQKMAGQAQKCGSKCVDL